MTRARRLPPRYKSVSMTPPVGTWMIGYGAFLIVMGIVGYLSNPEKAATALLSGGTFGTLSMAWGALLRRGHAWAFRGAMASTGLLAVVFTWRATVGWLAVHAGHSEKLVAAVLISAMDVASLATLWVLAASVRGERRAARGRPDA
jgi:uncharacterized membrane protein (UPF0136 family)